MLSSTTNTTVNSFSFRHHEEVISNINKLVNKSVISNVSSRYINNDNHLALEKLTDNQSDLTTVVTSYMLAASLTNNQLQNITKNETQSSFNCLLHNSYLAALIQTCRLSCGNSDRSLTCPAPYFTYSPTSYPSLFPTVYPTWSPTYQPTNPSGQPSTQPSTIPTAVPTMSPSSQPTTEPSICPTSQPTQSPSNPTGQPTSRPTKLPVINPTNQPSNQPSHQPSGQPSNQPLSKPSSKPSYQPTRQPSQQPTCQPSSQPFTPLPSSSSSRPTSTLFSTSPSLKPSTMLIEVTQIIDASSENATSSVLSDITKFTDIFTSFVNKVLIEGLKFDSGVQNYFVAVRSVKRVSDRNTTRYGHRYF